MPLTRDYRETILARARREPELREAMLKDGVQCLLSGEITVAKLALRNYIETEMGYEKLGVLADTPPKSLARMFGKKGTPNAVDLLKTVIHIQRHEGIQFEVKVVPAEVEDEDEAEMEAEPEMAAARWNTALTLDRDTGSISEETETP